MDERARPLAGGEDITSRMLIKERRLSMLEKMRKIKAVHREFCEMREQNRTGGGVQAALFIISI